MSGLARHISIALPPYVIAGTLQPASVASVQPRCLMGLRIQRTAVQTGSGSRDRTCDGLVNSQMLLPLSYPGIKLCPQKL